MYEGDISSPARRLNYRVLYLHALPSLPFKGNSYTDDTHPSLIAMELLKAQWMFHRCTQPSEGVLLIEFHRSVCCRSR